MAETCVSFGLHAYTGSSASRGAASDRRAVGDGPRSPRHRNGAPAPLMDAEFWGGGGWGRTVSARPCGRGRTVWRRCPVPTMPSRAVGRGQAPPLRRFRDKPPPLRGPPRPGTFRRGRACPVPPPRQRQCPGGRGQAPPLRTCSMGHQGAVARREGNFAQLSRWRPLKNASRRDSQRGLAQEAASKRWPVVPFESGPIR